MEMKKHEKCGLTLQNEMKMQQRQDGNTGKTLKTMNKVSVNFAHQFQTLGTNVTNGKASQAL